MTGASKGIRGLAECPSQVSEEYLHQGSGRGGVLSFTWGRTPPFLAAIRAVWRLATGHTAVSRANGSSVSGSSSVFSSRRGPCRGVWVQQAHQWAGAACPVSSQARGWLALHLTDMQPMTLTLGQFALSSGLVTIPRQALTHCLRNQGTLAWL